MKTKKLLRKIKAFFQHDKREQLAKYESLVKVLRKLEKKELKVRQKLEDETDSERRQEIGRKLEIIAAQRKKGEGLRVALEELREAE